MAVGGEHGYSSPHSLGKREAKSQHLSGERTEEGNEDTFLSEKGDS